jgi:hypothetical protein
MWSAASDIEDQQCFIVVMDRFADVRSALLPAECVLQSAMDGAGEGADNVHSRLQEVLMWAKGADSLQAHASGLDALLERRLEDAVQEVADMDCQNSFALKGVRQAAQAILGEGEHKSMQDSFLIKLSRSAQERPEPKDSPFRLTISTMYVGALCFCIVQLCRTLVGSHFHFFLFQNEACARNRPRRGSLSTALRHQCTTVRRSSIVVGHAFFSHEIFLQKMRSFDSF